MSQKTLPNLILHNFSSDKTHDTFDKIIDEFVTAILAGEKIMWYDCSNVYDYRRGGLVPFSNYLGEHVKTNVHAKNFVEERDAYYQLYEDTDKALGLFTGLFERGCMPAMKGMITCYMHYECTYFDPVKGIELYEKYKDTIADVGHISLNHHDTERKYSSKNEVTFQSILEAKQKCATAFTRIEKHDSKLASSLREKMEERRVIHKKGIEEERVKTTTMTRYNLVENVLFKELQFFTRELEHVSRVL